MGRRSVSLHPRGYDLAGYIPDMILFSDPRPAREQINERYSHGGGWDPMKGWTFDPESLAIAYDGVETYPAVYLIELDSGERIIIYPRAWVCIAQTDGSFEVGGMD